MFREDRAARLAAILLLAFASTHAGAASFESELDGRWLGAWIVVTAESYSDCAGVYTNNRVNGNLVRGGGRVGFESGELAKLDKIDVKRSRVDLLLSYQVPVLLSSADGPFTLYDEASCRVELEIEIPRSSVKERDLADVERRIAEVVERHETESSAKGSASWNERRREELPADYARTLAEYAVFRAERTNAAVQASLDHALEETARLGGRLGDETVYYEGLAAGVAAARSVDLGGCAGLVGVDLGEIRRQAARVQAKNEGTAAGFARGYEDGKVLVYGLEMIRALPACFVPVPPLPEETALAEARSG